MRSCPSDTTEAAFFSFQYRSRRVVLIDTPGFDDSNRTDTEILQGISVHLSQTYEDGIKLSGIIYLHRITDTRMTGSSLKNLQLFKALCGENFYGHVVLATTMWDELDEFSLSHDKAIAREKELVDKSSWWGYMVHRGSKVFRHTGNTESALQVVSYLVDLGSTAVLDIQREMVDENRNLENTSAGMVVQKELQEQAARYEKKLAELHKAQLDALKSKDTELRKFLLKEQEKIKRERLAAEKDRMELRMGYQQLKADSEKWHMVLSDSQKQADRQRAEDRRAQEISEERYRREMHSMREREAEMVRQLAMQREENRRAETERDSQHRQNIQRLLNRSASEKRELEERMKEVEHLQMRSAAEKRDLEGRVQKKIRKLEEESRVQASKLRAEEEQKRNSAAEEGVRGRSFGDNFVDERGSPFPISGARMREVQPVKVSQKYISDVPSPSTSSSDSLLASE